MSVMPLILDDGIKFVYADLAADIPEFPYWNKLTFPIAPLVTLAACGQAGHAQAPTAED